ncbi:hypothetical protein JOC86_004319 [Bacillus pakistanensis]|uniref:Uncharacterized protein n=1 Tax=Rossellomorea pakistanensis TaxID=992288 RepID=A0ABS2NIP8_9BACI|nr:hypothetical protein [Bacillus pakistanensis]MBM7587745.1 hypothetical protein [Bacillus pakistanensis]
MSTQLDEATLYLAKQLIWIDLLRDEIWEIYANKAGNQAYEILRKIQNGAAL